MRPLLLTSLSAVALSLVAAQIALARPREELDASSVGPAPQASAQRLAAVTSDARLSLIATPSETDSRFGVPTFLWTARTSPPATRASAASRDLSAAARDQVSGLAPFYGLEAADVRGLTLHHLHDTGRGGVIATFHQSIGGIEVFRDELMLNLDRDGELISASGFVPPAALAGAASRTFTLSMAEAVRIAVQDLAGATGPTIEAHATGLGPGGYERFDLAAGALELSDPIRAKPVYFHMPGALIPAYEVEVLAGEDCYAYIVSAADGSLLFRHSLVQNDTYTYRAWAEPTGDRYPMDGPQGLTYSPRPTGVPDYSAPSFVLPGLVSLQNGPISTSDAWLAPGATLTSGNNVDAYADLVTPDGFTAGDLRASTTGANTFDRTYDTAQNPNLSANQQMASVTQLFYTTNFLHDWYYDSGFTESAGNAQVSNYGRGGVEGDQLRAEAQDFGSTNNANMSTPADGGRPRMQMYVWTYEGLGQIAVSSPPSLAGNYFGAAANALGPQTFNVSGEVVLADEGVGTTSDACSAIVNNVAGKIALIDRVGCTNLVKMQAAQAAGAIAVIMVDVIDGPRPPLLSGSGTVTIPVLQVTSSVGASFKSALTSGTVTATLVRSPVIRRDGTLDNMLVAHEWGHYISNRLIGNSHGLSNKMGSGLGEGWGDFHALLLTVRAGDDVDGTYAFSAYALHPITGSYSDDWYFGLRRMPYSTQMTKNGLTFRHIQDGVALPVGPPTLANGFSNSEVHNTGEVWCTMLWECYASLLHDNGRLTFTQARSRMKDYLVAAYQLTPPQPTLTEARDALLSAAYAGDPADLALFWQAFAKRGAGVGAISPDRLSSTNAGVTESYTLVPDILTMKGAVVTDDVSSCDHDGLTDPGETGSVTLTLRNMGATALTSAVVHVASTNPDLSFPAGGDFNLPSIAAFAASAVHVPIHLGTSAGLGTTGLQITSSNPSLSGAATFSHDAWVGADEAPTATIETVDAPTQTWAFSPDSAFGATLWSRVQVAPTDYRFFAPNAAFPAGVSLVTPPLQIGGGGSFRVIFDHAYSFEFDATAAYDGGVVEISNNGGSTWTDVGASLTPGYTGTLAAGSSNPIRGRAAFARTSPGYPATSTQTLDLGTTYAGQTVQLRFRLGSDNLVGAPGWTISQLQFEQVTNQPFRTLVPEPGPCTAVAVEDDPPTEIEFALTGPQPVSGSARFGFALPAPARVAITIHDLAGRRVATVLDGEFLAGPHTASWDRGSDGTEIPAGVYFARMSTAGKGITRRVVILR